MKKQRKTIVTILLKWAGIILAGYLCFTQLIGVHIQTGNTMYPALKDGDVVVFFRRGNVNITDAVLYEDPISGRVRTSRVVGIPGNKVSLTDQEELVIDAQTPDGIYFRTEPVAGSAVEYPCLVPGDAYFLLDDNRVIGEDSRIAGTVSRDRIKGRVFFIFRKRGV